MPTLAHFLIRTDDALGILLRTFMSELRVFKDDSGKLNLQKRLPDNPRSFFILYDIKYLLSKEPEETDLVSSFMARHEPVPQPEPEGAWDVDLRKGFLHGFSLLTEVLASMQVCKTKSCFSLCLFL